MSSYRIMQNHKEDLISWFKKAVIIKDLVKDTKKLTKRRAILIKQREKLTREIDKELKSIEDKLETSCGHIDVDIKYVEGYTHDDWAQQSWHWHEFHIECKDCGRWEKLETKADSLIFKENKTTILLDVDIVNQIIAKLKHDIDEQEHKKAESRKQAAEIELLNKLKNKYER